MSIIGMVIMLNATYTYEYSRDGRWWFTPLTYLYFAVAFAFYYVALFIAIDTYILR